MTIPTQPVNIRPEYVEPPRASPWAQIILQAIERRQQLDLAKKKLAQEQQQFELTSRLTGEQIEGAKLTRLQRQREFDEQEKDLIARDQALQLFTGNLPRLTDMRGLGEVMAGVKDARVAGHLLTFLGDAQKVFNPPGQNFELKVVPDPASPTGYSYQGLNPRNPAAGPVPTGAPAPDPKAPVERIPVVTEREKASYAVGAMQANAVVNRLERQDPNIAARVARKTAVRKSIMGGLVHRLTGSSPEERDLIVEQQIELSMTPQELEFYQAAKQFLANVIPAIAGKQMTAREYAIQAPSFFSMGATNPQVTAARRRSRASRIRGFITEAGEAFPERLPEVAGLEELWQYGIGQRPKAKSAPVSGPATSAPNPANYFRP